MIVKAPQQVAQQEVDDWWMGQIIFCEGGARDPRVNTMFQISNVDDGGIHWVKRYPLVSTEMRSPRSSVDLPQMGETSNQVVSIITIPPNTQMNLITLSAKLHLMRL